LKKKVGIIGAGNMGEAIIKGLQDRKKFSVCVYEKNKTRSKKISKKYDAKKNTLEQLTNTCNIIIICVKPQDIDSLFLDIKQQVNNKQLLISIAAGITISHIEKSLGKKVTVVRAMPNLPGLIGQGFTAYCLGKNAASQNAKDTEAIFKTMGKVLKTKESKMNAITAISGSGPGFYAYYINAFQDAAVAIGINKKDAKVFSLNAAAGTANMLLETDTDPAQMVKRVASPGGTTEAGLKEMNKGKIKQTLKNTIKAAAKRAKELSK